MARWLMKSGTAVLLTACMLAASTAAGPQRASAQQHGDADGSGTVNDDDVQAILDYLVGQPATSFDEQAADINRDGSVALIDALLLVVRTDDAYAANLALVKAQTVRNTNHDDSPFADTPQLDLDISDSSPLLGPRSDYLGNPNGNPSQAFPTVDVGDFRTQCEFSHFAYDDPVILPNQPGAAHLHMFFGNTDVNAYSTYDSLTNTGSSTCNGQELNRTGYWVPAMIDGEGNVRIPERIVVYYKGYGRANGARFPTTGGSQPYRPGMANVSPFPVTVPEVPDDQGGKQNQVNYKCSNNFSALEFASGVDEIPNCSGDHYGNYPVVRTVLEMDVKFWNCFPTGADVTDYRVWKPAPRDDWFSSNCAGVGGGQLVANETYPSLEYFVNYVVEPGEDTSGWYLASDIDPDSVTGTPTLRGLAGSTHHGDWWGGWHPTINQEWLDNCVNYYTAGVIAGCGLGYLSDGGTDNSDPLPGRALRFAPQFDTPGQTSSYKVPMSTVFAELCAPLDPGRELTTPAAGAWCKPG